MSIKHIELTNFFKKKRIRVLLFSNNNDPIWVKPDESDFDIPFTDVEEGLFTIHSIDNHPTKVVLSDDFRNELMEIMDNLSVGERVFLDIENEPGDNLKDNIIRISKSNNYAEKIGDE